MAETIIDSKVESTEVTLTLKSSYVEDTAMNVTEEEKGRITDPLDDVKVAPTTSTLGPEKTQPEPKTQDEQELSDTQESSDESAFEAIEAEAGHEDVEVLAHVSTNSIAAFAAHQHIDLSASSTTRDAEYSHFSASSMEETFFEDDEDYADDDESCAFSLIDNHSIFIMQASSDEPSTVATKASSNASASRHTHDGSIPSLSGKESTMDKLANSNVEQPLVVSTHLHAGTTMTMDDPKHTKHINVAFFYMEESVEMTPLWDQHFLNENHEQNGKQDDKVQQPPMGASKQQTPNKIDSQLTISTVPVKSLTKILTDHKNTNTAPHENLSRLSIATAPSQTSSLTKSSRGSSIHNNKIHKLPSKLAISKPRNTGVHLITLDPKQLKPRTERKKPEKMIEESITIVKPVKHRRRGTRPSYHKYVNRQIQRQVEEWNDAMAVAQAEEATPKHSNDRKTRQMSKKSTSFVSSDSLLSEQSSGKETELEKEMRAMLISSQKMSNKQDRRVVLDAFLRMVEERVAEHKAKAVNDPDFDLVENKDGPSSKSTYLEEEGFLLSFSGFCNMADEDFEESIETMTRKTPALGMDSKPQVIEAKEKDSCELDEKALEKQLNSRATSEEPVTHGEIVKGNENHPEALEAVLVRKPVFFPRAARRQRALSGQYGAEKRIQNAMSPKSPKSTRRWWKRFSKQNVQDSRHDHEMTNTVENGQVEQRDVEQREVEEETIQRQSEDDQHEVTYTDTLCCALNGFAGTV